ncbi:hypothetical protein BZG24_29835, partial [Escherichia coli]|uniref:aldo/keto reductase n=1 Tax=Escherichia coli TaxID=562 RepID=UPI0022AF5976
MSFTSAEDSKDIRLKNTVQFLRNSLNLFYLHRINPEIPVEEVAFGIGKMIDSGRIKGWGLSQVSEDEIRLAHNVTQLTA